MGQAGGVVRKENPVTTKHVVSENERIVTEFYVHHNLDSAFTNDTE